MEPERPVPPFEDVVVAIDGLVRSIAPAAVAWGEGAVPQGYLLPDDLVPFVLVRVAQTGVDVSVRTDSTDPYVGTFASTTDAGWSDFEHAIRSAVTRVGGPVDAAPRFSDSAGPLQGRCRRHLAPRSWSAGTSYSTPRAGNASGSSPCCRGQ